MPKTLIMVIGIGCHMRLVPSYDKMRLTKILIFTSDKNDLSRFAAEFRVIDWENANFALNINFADYDGLILDVDSLTKLRESQDEPVYASNLEAQLSSAIVADIASRKDGFVVVVGNPSTKIDNCSVAFLLGFDIEVKCLAGSNLLKNTSAKKNMLDTGRR